MLLTIFIFLSLVYAWVVNSLNESLVHALPDVKINFWLFDAALLKVFGETSCILFEHVGMHRPPVPGPSHECTWLQISHLASLAVFIRNFNVLISERMNHHVPGISVGSLSPSIVALCNEMGIGKEQLYGCINDKEAKSKIKTKRFWHSRTRVKSVADQ